MTAPTYAPIPRRPRRLPGLVRELRVTYARPPVSGPDSPGAILSPEDAACVFARFGLPLETVEVFAVVLLDTKNRPIAYHVVSRGNLNTCPVHPRAVFLAAIAANAHAILHAHNHPSGDPAISGEDVRLHQRLVDAGTLLGIPVLDGLVVAGRIWTSIAPGSSGTLPAEGPTP